MRTPSYRESYRAIVERLTTLAPDAVALEVDAMTSGRLQAWAPKLAPARSAEHGLPVSDTIDAWVAGRVRRLDGIYAEARRQLDLAHAVEAQILYALDSEEARRLIDEEHPSRECVVCHVIVPDDERIIAARCAPCYEYRRRHHGKDAPRHVWSERV